MKKYFIQDIVLQDSDKDFFRHRDLANNIASIINNNEYKTPYNIALIGPWGIGKSSLLKFVEPQIRKKCNIFYINAWKYEKESLKRVYLKDIYEQITEKKVTRKTTIDKVLDFIKQLNNEDNSTNKISIRYVIKLLFKPLLYVLIFSILFALITKNVEFISNGGNYKILFNYGFFTCIFKFLNYYFQNFTQNFIFPIVVLLLGYIMTELLSKIKNSINIEIPIENCDDYEIILKKEIKKLKETTKKDKIVVIIDDLDRLSTSKIVEALDTLKSLMEIEKCIFIVPFDDTLIKNVLEKKVVSQVDSEHQTIRSELILDKLFQFKFYLLPLVKSDIKDYTIRMIRQEAPDFPDLFTIEDNNYFEEIMKKTVIYNGLETPRQIKKIINVLANNILIIRERCKYKVTESNLLTHESLYLISKISVLQADFNDFYDTLFINNSYIEKVLEIHRTPINYDDIPYELKFLFEQKNKVNKGMSQIKKENEKLINFLIQTETVSNKNIGAFLHLNQDKFSAKYGSEFNSSFTEAFESGNYVTVTAKISDSSQDINDLVKNILEEVSNENLLNCLLSSYNIVSELVNFQDFNLISQKTNELYLLNSSELANFNYMKIPFENLLKVYINSAVDYKVGSENLICDYIRQLFIIENLNSENFKSIINCLLINDDNISNKIKNTLKNEFNNLIQDKENFNTNFFVENINVMTIKQFRYYLGMHFFESICTEIENDDDKMSDAYAKWLNLSVDSLISENADVVYSHIVDLYDNKFNLSILNSIVFRYWGDKNE